MRHTARGKSNVLIWTHAKEKEIFILSGRRDAKETKKNSYLKKGGKT